MQVVFDDAAPLQMPGNIHDDDALIAAQEQCGLQGCRALIVRYGDSANMRPRHLVARERLLDEPTSLAFKMLAGLHVAAHMDDHDILGEPIAKLMALRVIVLHWRINTTTTGG